MGLGVLGLSRTSAQSTFIPLNDDYYHLIDRLEIKRGKLSEGFHSNMKPFERKAVVQLTDSILADGRVRLTRVDAATINYLRNDSWEWTLGTPQVPTPAADSAQLDSTGVSTDAYSSLSRLGSIETTRRNRTFWSHPADLYSIHNEDVDLHVNFTTNNFYGRENDTPSALWFTGRGVEIRGMVNQKLGFYTFVSDNQGTFADYVRRYAWQYNFPGEGLAKTLRNTGVDFLSARGYITFRPLKSINVQFGHDRNFIGSGYRSMILSDNSSPYLFMRIETHLGRFHYTNLWASMINTQDTPSRDMLRSKKYAAMHHLSINLTDRLNVGVFEAEVFKRDSTQGGFDPNYLNPIIFYRFVESYLGSEDNALLGFDFRWLAGRRLSVYGQFILDEFLTKYFFSSSGSWTKKYAGQLGIKYIDAFGIPNLDLQAEYNVARPYQYTHRDGGRNYVHYRQPLAHPLGANFREWVGILRYKMTPRLTTYYTLSWTNQGLDRYGENWGSNLLPDYETRMSDFGNTIAQGVTSHTLFSDVRLSYMLTHNLFIDGRYLWRRQDRPGENITQSTNLATIALRYNIPYRLQTF
ncbi:hypothetical protein GCM10027275_01740 [Rhabdobacter roseus]